tara:strand:+ start:28298 stop:28897 length:600 start_codon:yes stop_codon:yes gene_type:complete
MLQMRLYLLLFFGFQILISGSSPKTNTSTKNEGKVLIHPNRPLNWGDFKRVDLIGNRSTINAITQSTCEIEILKITQKKEYVALAVNVKINLQKELSQVKNNFFNTRDEQTKKRVLHHENGHFLIAQIVGHRILKEVNNFQFDEKAYKAQLNKIIRDNFKDWKRLDSQYDAQSTKPHNPEMQARWDRFFQSELESLQKE